MGCCDSTSPLDDDVNALPGLSVTVAIVMKVELDIAGSELCFNFDLYLFVVTGKVVGWELMESVRNSGEEEGDEAVCTCKRW
jgi:hypothetical protein